MLSATIVAPKQANESPAAILETPALPTTSTKTPAKAKPIAKISKPPTAISKPKPPMLPEPIPERVAEDMPPPPLPEAAPSPMPQQNVEPPRLAENKLPNSQERSGAKIKAPEPIDNPTQPAGDAAVIVPTRPIETPVERQVATPIPDIATAPHPIEPIAQDGPPRVDKIAPVPAPELPTPSEPVVPKASPAAPANSPVVQAKKDGLPLPANGEARYKLRMGIVSGELTLTWKFGDGRYRLDSVAQGSGLFAIAGSYVQMSEGEIAENGLRPSLYSRERRNKKDVAEFNWADNSVRFSDKGGSHTEPLPLGAQDLLSLLFQLAFVPPLGDQLTVIVSNGRKLETYTFERTGDEILDLQDGKFHTIKIIKSRANKDDDIMEVWLALEHHYLPVKIRVTDKKGSVIEQTLTAMKVVSAN